MDGEVEGLVAKLVSGLPACHGKLSGFESGQPSKIINGRLKNTGVVNTL